MLHEKAIIFINYKNWNGFGLIRFCSRKLKYDKSSYQKNWNMICNKSNYLKKFNFAAIFKNYFVIFNQQFHITWKNPQRAVFCFKTFLWKKIFVTLSRVARLKWFLFFLFLFLLKFHLKKKQLRSFSWIANIVRLCTLVKN